MAGSKAFPSKSLELMIIYNIDLLGNKGDGLNLTKSRDAWYIFILYSGIWKMSDLGTHLPGYRNRKGIWRRSTVVY